MGDKGATIDALLTQECGHFLEGFHSGIFPVFFPHSLEVVDFNLDKEQSLCRILSLRNVFQVRAELVGVVESGYGVGRDSAFLVKTEYDKGDDNESG